MTGRAGPRAADRLVGVAGRRPDRERDRRWPPRWPTPGTCPTARPALAELDRIAARADAAGDPRSALDARFALIEAYLLHGERWRLVEPVRRCRAAVDRGPACSTRRR